MKCAAGQGNLSSHSPRREGNVGAPGVQRALSSESHSLNATSRNLMESRFGHDFSHVRVHHGRESAASAKDVGALAYTVGADVVFGAGQYAPETDAGRHLLAHELAHVVQQGAAPGQSINLARVSSESSTAESEADAAADAVLAGRPVGLMAPSSPGVQRRAAPYIKKVTVHLAPTQNAVLEWEGTPPAAATGSDSFTVSTGKGYSDPEDPPGTCTRSCCSDAMTQCAPPWNRPDRVGACCTYFGNSFWTGTPLEEHNGWKWWTPVQPFYSSRGIALHQHDTVTGEAIGHGCVRMDEPNAKRIYDYSNGQRTNVTIDGRAAPVACDQSRRCAGADQGTTGQRAEQDTGAEPAELADEQTAVPGMEGVMT